jgi:hypothetical protein
MSRLVVHPNSAESWEIQLNPGTNSLGRRPENDFQINDVSISGFHCHIVVNNSQVTVKDLGSTNGTFLNHNQIQEATLENAQTLRLGNVDMVFYSQSLAETTISRQTNSAVSARMRPVFSPPAASVSVGTVLLPTPVDASTSEEATEFTEAPPLPPPVIPDVASGPRYCKFHPKSFARYHCPKCDRLFCGLCVGSRRSAGVAVYTCRSCGVETTPLKITPIVVQQKNFFASLRGAFAYPFRGAGIFILILGTIVLGLLNAVSGHFIGRILGIVLFAKLMMIGYIFIYMQKIIHATASEDAEMPPLPETDEWFEALLSLGGTVAMSFGPAIGLAVIKFGFDIEMIPTSIIVLSVLFGCIYFPMAFLVTAMKETAFAANPLVVIPSILRVPREYAVTVVLMAGIYGIQQLGNFIVSIAESGIFTAHSLGSFVIMFAFAIVWSFICVYLMTVNTRIIGLLYLTKKDELGWF